jgi:hypothetical protein
LLELPVDEFDHALGTIDAYVVFRKRRQVRCDSPSSHTNFKERLVFDLTLMGGKDQFLCRAQELLVTPILGHPRAVIDSAVDFGCPHNLISLWSSGLSFLHNSRTSKPENYLRQWANDTVSFWRHGSAIAG